MQQYRVNYSLLIGLIVGTLVCSGAVYGLWRFQIDRKSGWLISEAEKARADGDLREATRYYWQYLTIRSQDDDARIKYAHACADLSEQDDVTPEELNTAWRALESTLRDRTIAPTPEAKELRPRLVKLYGSDNVRRYQDALDHLDIMLQDDPDDASLQVLRAKYLVHSSSFDEAITGSNKLIGYDPTADSFDVKKAIAPHEVDVYANLAGILRGKQNKPELAERVMEQLIEVNPDSAKAYLARGRFRLMTDDAEAGRADLDKAYQLDPKDADVLLAVANDAANNKDYDKASEVLAAGKKLHAQVPRFYQAAAELAVQQQDHEQALAQIDEGLKTIKGQKGNVLLLAKADLQLRAGNSKGVKETTEEMARAGFRSEFVEWYEALILLAEDNWPDAQVALSRLRPKVATGFGDLPLQVDSRLALCYEKLGRRDLALELYGLILQQDQENEYAKAGQQRVRAEMGLESPDGETNPFQELIEQELKKPKAERNWAKVDEMLPKFAEERKWDEATIKLYQTQLLVMREDFAGASKALADANRLSPKNLQIRRMAVQLVRLDPKRGPAEAMKLWTKVVDEFGDQAPLRLDKADILIALHKDQENKDELKAELAGLASGIDDWPVARKVELWRGLAGRFLNLGMSQEARPYLTLAADNKPEELPLRLGLFALALDANDDAGMKEAQDKVLEIVKDKNDSDWLYTEARRKLSLVRRRQLGPETLDEIRMLVSRALQQRAGWHELHVLNAELELMANNAALALEHFDRAAKLGRPSPSAVANHIRLLAGYGRFSDAGAQLERIPESLRQPLLGQLYPEILFRTNQVEDAIGEARAASEADPNSAEKHYWHSQLLFRAAQAPENSEEKRKQGISQAIDVMRKAVELRPEFPEAWYALISYHSLQKDMPQAEAVLRDAQLALSGESLQLFLAKGYEALGRWFDAETMYRALYEGAPDDLSRVQQLAAFYLSDVYRRPDQQQKVTPLINKILRAGGEGKIPPSDPNLLWARRMAAKILAATGDYQNLLKAENLLASNAKDGILSVESKLEMADILAPRPDPVSRFKAIALLEEVSKAQPLNEHGEITLGQLYYLVGKDWGTYAAQMRKAYSRFPNSVSARAAYVENLLNRSDQRSIDEAVRQVNKIRELAPDSPTTFDLTVRLAVKVGRQQAVIPLIVKRLPNLDDPKALSDQQAQTLPVFAKYLVDLGDLDNAERIYRALAARDVNQVPALASFLGMHRDVEQCFTKLNEVYSVERIPPLLQIALSVVRQRRDQVGDKFDAELERWLAAGLRENPDSISLLMLQADLRDLQTRYDDAAKIYLNLLSRNDLTGFRRAVVLNNVSFLVSLAESAAVTNVDPLKLVQEAAQIIGPNSDILDTRAVVYIAGKEYKKAIDDLTLSVTDNPTASKYFHKAQAHLLAGDNRAAIDAWEKAEELGLSRDSLNRMEFERYERMKSDIDRLRGASVTQAEPVRRET